MARSSDDSEDEDFVVLGTALPEFDESDAPKKPTTVQDLTAKDKEGRRRFHGAFTGGFSAGYFNSVGSKEGFTPSTFVSSRSQKHDDASTSRPEDFMDDEDLDEHGIAPRKFATAKNFTSDERKRKLEEVSKELSHSSSLDLGGVLNDLVIPEYLPIGIKLLRKMGWRDGQGLGPRVRRKKKMTKEKKKGGADKKKIYGCALPSSDSDSADSDSFIPANMSDLTFAPTDITPISLAAKDDVKGLGYRGLDPTLALPGSHINLFSHPVRGKKASRGIKGHAFGVGALEDDDDDIFALDSMANYDMTMKEEGDEDGNFGWTAPRSHGKQQVPVSYVGKLLEGFCLSSNSLKPGKKFPPPTLPQNFKPYHWSRKKKKEEIMTGGKGNRITAVDRGLMLGETPIMSSVFDLVNTKDKSQIQSAKEAIEMTKSLQESTASTTPTTVLHGNEKTVSDTDRPQKGDHHQPKFLSRFTPATTDITNTEANTSSPSTNTPLFHGSLSLQPFRKDPAKQARYDAYLAGAKQGIPDPYSGVSNSSMTEWEKAREKEEFGRSAKLFRPMSAMMSTRFVHGAMIDDGNEDSKMENKEDVSDEAKAAEMKMFGKLTREEFEWHPDKLVCRRFNVPNPYPGSDIVGLPNVKRDKYSIFNFLSIGDFQPKDEMDISKAGSKRTNKEPEEKVPDTPAKKKASLASIFKVLGDPDFHKPSKEAKTEISKAETNEMDEEEKKEDEEEATDIDLFRAIFKNSDSEDTEEEKSEKEVDDSMSDEQDEKNINNDGAIETNLPVISSNIPNNEMSTPNVKEVKCEVESPMENPANEEREEDTTTPMKTPSLSATNNSFGSVFLDPGVKSRRPESRWGPKSIFSVLDDVNNDMECQKSTGNDEDFYGPALPPPLESTSQPQTALDGVRHRVDHGGTKYEESQRNVNQHHHRDKHKHKKEKKKRSKHKKEKKHKKSKKSSKSKKSKPGHSGSEADSETDDEESDGELLERLKQVSRSKPGKS